MTGCLVDEFDRELLFEIVLAEAHDLLTAWEDSLVQLERSPRNEELINTIFRVAHTMKGNAATIGDESIVAVAHAAEDLLDRLRARAFEPTAELVTLLLACGDHMRTLVTHASQKMPIALPPDPALIAALQEASRNGSYTAGSAENGNGGNRADHHLESTVRTSVTKLDGMLALAGEISIVRSRMRTMITASASAELREAQERLDRLCNDLEADLMRVRMIPIEPVLNQQARLVRDLAQTSGKLVEFQCSGSEVEADTTVIEQLRATLGHMIRNAVDHGIERPDVRLRAGKSEMGTVTIRAAHDAGMLVIDVSDDGAGIDTKRVLAKARALGLTDSAELTEAETRRLIFTPGFSTAETVTEVSGRGVGMDVVHQMIVSMRGSISVTSAPGSGTTFSIRVPLSLAIIDALAVEAAGETYVLPLEFVTECIDVDETALHDAQAGTIVLREQTIPFVRLAAFMGVTTHNAGRKSAVILSNRKRVTALVLDRLIGRVEAVVKPLRGFSKLQGIAGATVLGDGSIALILDVPRLLQKQIREAA